MSTLVINAGLGGQSGNSQLVALRAARELALRGEPHQTLVLEQTSPDALRDALERSQRLVFVTGTYWGGFSSRLQHVFEQLTPSEGSALWLGKPAAVLVSAHQVGAQGVLWRVQGLLVTLGCLIPPMSGVVITKVGEELRRRAPELCTDVWGLEDVATALHNLLAAPLVERYRAWPIDAEHYAQRWLEE